jgi:anti-sigma factor RsiW
MNCRESRRLFNRRLDQRLSESEATALDSHLSGCAGCRAELARWEVPSRALRLIGAAPVPDGLSERAWRAALTSSPAPSFEERFVWAARRAAAVAVLAAGLVWGGVWWLDPGNEAAELALPPDAAEMAMTLWAAEPAAELAAEVDFDVE